MEYNYQDGQTRYALEHLRECMQKYYFGSREYELARKSYAYICNRIRITAKTEIVE